MTSCVESAPPYEFIVESGVIPRLIQFLQFDNFTRLQFEAAWILTNITTENTAVVIKHGAVPAFVQLLEYKNKKSN